MRVPDGIAFELGNAHDGPEGSLSWRVKVHASQDYSALVTKGRSVDYTFVRATAFVQECSCGCGAQTIGAVVGALGLEVGLSFGLWRVTKKNLDLVAAAARRAALLRTVRGMLHADEKPPEKKEGGG